MMNPNREPNDDEARLFIMLNDNCYRNSSETIRLSRKEPHRSNNNNAGSDRRYLPLLHQFDDVIEDIDIPHILNDLKTTLTFPETLLLLLVQAERDERKRACTTTKKSCIGWALNGRALIIRNKDELVNKLLPMALPKAKFTSFTRKLYRWGFRQVRDEAYLKLCRAGEMTFWHPYFQRDNKPLMSNMKSTTAEGTRRALASSSSINLPSLVTAQDPPFIATSHLFTNRDQTRAAPAAFEIELPFQSQEMISTPIPRFEGLALPLPASVGCDGFDRMSEALIIAAARTLQSHSNMVNQVGSHNAYVLPILFLLSQL